MRKRWSTFKRRVPSIDISDLLMAGPLFVGLTSSVVLQFCVDTSGIGNPMWNATVPAVALVLCTVLFLLRLRFSKPAGGGFGKITTLILIGFGDYVVWGGVLLRMVTLVA